jgi:hypothetical protein
MGAPLRLGTGCAAAIAAALSLTTLKQPAAIIAGSADGLGGSRGSALTLQLAFSWKNNVAGAVTSREGLGLTQVKALSCLENRCDSEGGVLRRNGGYGVVPVELGPD